jgi:tetratricopeptide (TPR) repeat protein
MLTVLLMGEEPIIPHHATPLDRGAATPPGTAAPAGAPAGTRHGNAPCWAPGTACRAGSPRRARWRPWVAAAVIVAAGVVVYANSLRGVFLFDDLRGIRDNPELRQVWPPWGFWTSVNYAGRPVLALTLAVNYAMGETEPWGYHAVNLAIHLLAGLTLFGVVRRTLREEDCGSRIADCGFRDDGALRPNPQSAIRSPQLKGRTADGLAFAVALLWTVHPLQTQAVTYVVQRGESLMGLFYLLTLYAVVRAAAVRSRLGGYAWSAGAVAACALGMATKQVMITAPLVVFLYDLIFLSVRPVPGRGRSADPPRTGVAASLRETLRRRGWLYLGLAATWLVVAPRILAIGGFFFDPSPPGWARPLPTSWEYLRSQPGILAHYLSLAFWPRTLSLDYAWPVAETAREILPPAILVAALLGATLWALWRRPAAAFLGLMFFLILAPTCSIVPMEDLAFEHRMYLPLAAVVAAVVVGAYWLGLYAAVWGTRRVCGRVARRVCGRVARRADDHAEDARPDGGARRNGRAPAAQAAGPDGAHHCGGSGDPSAHAAGAPPRNAESTVGQAGRGRRALGWALAVAALGAVAVPLGYRTVLRNADYASAVGMWQATVAACPANGRAYGNLGTCLFAAGDRDGALRALNRAIELGFDSADAYCTRGSVYQAKGQLDRALGDYRRAVEMDPRNVEALNNLGTALQALGRHDQAITYYTQAVTLRPDLADAYYNRGNAWYAAGQADRAIGDFARAIHLRPDYAEAYDNRGLAWKAKGLPDRAIQDHSRAIALKPRSFAAYVNRGNVYQDLGQLDRAIEDYSAAIALQPGAPAAHAAGPAKAYYNRAVAYAAKGLADKAAQDFTRAIQLEPNLAEAYNNRGLLYRDKGLLDKAVEDFTQAIRLKPNLAVAYGNRATCHYHLKAYGKAWADVRQYEQLGGRVSPEFLQLLREASGGAAPP